MLDLSYPDPKFPDSPKKEDKDLPLVDLPSKKIQPEKLPVSYRIMRFFLDYGGRLVLWWIAFVSSITVITGDLKVFTLGVLLPWLILMGIAAIIFLMSLVSRLIGCLFR